MERMVDKFHHFHKKLFVNPMTKNIKKIKNVFSGDY